MHHALVGATVLFLAVSTHAAVDGKLDHRSSTCDFGKPPWNRRSHLCMQATVCAIPGTCEPICFVLNAVLGMLICFWIACVWSIVSSQKQCCIRFLWLVLIHPSWANIRCVSWAIDSSGRSFRHIILHPVWLRRFARTLRNNYEATIKGTSVWCDSCRDNRVLFRSH